MVDIDKVIKAWEIFRDSNPYQICEGIEFRAISEPEYCMSQMIADTLELLKEKQPRKVQNIRKVTDICLCGECPSCGKRVFTSANQNFCGHCGDRLTWKDGEQVDERNI